MTSQKRTIKHKGHWLRFATTLLLTSIVTGIGGIILYDLLEFVEWTIFGHGESTGAQPVTHIQFWIVIFTGVFAAFIWFILQAKNRHIISIQSQRDATEDSKRPVIWIHVINIILQVASVGAGSPIGKEGAPREFGALSAGWISDRLGLSLPERRIAIICGASAGLAAVYQVPIASIFFAFETLDLEVSFWNLLFVSSTTILTSLIAGIAISDEPLYHATPIVINVKTCCLIFILAMVITPLAQVFRHFIQKAQANKITTKSILWKLPLTFVALASFSLVFPEILGNGGALAQLVFNGMNAWNALACVIIKAIFVLLTLKNGAYGGTLTSSFAIGAVLGFLVATVCQLVIPGLSLNSAMLIGSSIFLAVTMNAPLTAIGLVTSFTGQPFIALPLLFFTVMIAFTIKTSMTHIERKYSHVNTYRSQTRRHCR